MNLIKQPSLVTLAENPVIFGMHTNNQIVNAGGQSFVHLYFPQVHYSSGIGFTLTFLGNSYQFSSAVSPDDSGLQFPAAVSGVDDNLTWMKKIAEALSANFYISSIFDVTYNYNLVYIVAKNVGSQNIISVSGITIPGMHGNYNGPGWDKQSRNYFNLFAQVIMDNKVIGEDLRPVDVNGNVHFDFSEYLRAQLGNSFQYPETTTDLLIIRPDACKPYFVRYSESYQVNQQVKIQKLHSTGTLYALNGGISETTQQAYAANLTSFWDQVVLIRKKFLTWTSNFKPTGKDDKQKLYFIAYNSQATSPYKVRLQLRLEVQIPNVNNHVINVITKREITVSNFNVVETVCSYKALQIDYHMLSYPAGSELISYAVFITDTAGDLLIDPFTFEMDYKKFLNPHEFLFSTSLAMYEYVKFTGVKTFVPEYANNIIDQSRDISFNTATKKVSSIETQKFTVNSGWHKNKHVADWMREFALSREVYEIVDGILVPVVIISEKLSVYQDKVYNYFSEFEYVHAYTNEHYSKNEVLPGQNIPHVIIGPIFSNNINIQPDTTLPQLINNSII